MGTPLNFKTYTTTSCLLTNFTIGYIASNIGLWWLQILSYALWCRPMLWLWLRMILCFLWECHWWLLVDFCLMNDDDYWSWVGFTQLAYIDWMMDLIVGSILFSLGVNTMCFLDSCYIYEYSLYIPPCLFTTFMHFLITLFLSFAWHRWKKFMKGKVTLW